MSEPIGVGDWVECWKLSEPRKGLFQIGALYRVREVVPIAPHPLNFEGIPSPHEAGLGLLGCGWTASFFRPIYRPKQSIIEALKAPVTRTPKVVKPIREDA